MLGSSPVKEDAIPELVAGLRRRYKGKCHFVLLNCEVHRIRVLYLFVSPTLDSMPGT